MFIPIYLLWHIQITVRQKIALGASFCLSIVMISTAAVRVFGIRPGHGKDNHNWQIFWQVAETCIAVTMVSLSTFRSFFVAHESRLREPRNRPWYMSRRNNPRKSLWKRRWGIESYDMMSFPPIPRATLTGMRTFIRGQTHSAELIMRTEQSSKGNELHLIGYEENSHEIKVDCSISVQPDEVRCYPGHSPQISKNSSGGR